MYINSKYQMIAILLLQYSYLEASLLVLKGQTEFAITKMMHNKGSNTSKFSINIAYKSNSDKVVSTFAKSFKLGIQYSVARYAYCLHGNLQDNYYTT